MAPEHEVQLLRLAEPLDARIAEADALLFGLGNQRNVGLGGEGDADARSVNGGAELRFGVYMNDDCGPATKVTCGDSA